MARSVYGAIAAKALSCMSWNGVRLKSKFEKGKLESINGYSNEYDKRIRQYEQDRVDMRRCYDGGSVFRTRPTVIMIRTTHWPFEMMINVESLMLVFLLKLIFCFMNHPFMKQHPSDFRRKHIVAKKASVNTQVYSLGGPTSMYPL
ncbi:hypothetical protein HJC23_000858 [Cyclotella cryptica]|uniref:Uncharacterized protein n=1 Tax=Cyclotella cryptica TaxID=29204 RepID=A0ABD3PVE0_9STRA